MFPIGYVGFSSMGFESHTHYLWTIDFRLVKEEKWFQKEKELKKLNNNKQKQTKQKIRKTFRWGTNCLDAWG